MSNSLAKYTIKHISKRLNQINPRISLSHQTPFPERPLLSHYRFKKKFVEIHSDGTIKGGMPRMVTSLIDFSFIRSITAHCYSEFGPPCYDPPSLFLVDLFRHLEGYPTITKFREHLRDEDKGRGYRSYAGLSMTHLPCEATFSNFRARLGEILYNEIFHVLVDIFHKLEMVTFKVLAHDGTLYPTWARYKGCTYFCDECPNITVENILEKARSRILYRLNHMTENSLAKESRIYAQCPSGRFPDGVKKPKIELFAFKLAFSDGQLSLEQQNTANLFGVAEELEKQHLCVQTLRSNILNINPDTGSISMCCHKLPKDTDARIGVRRDPQNPDKKQKIFGYNAVISTSVELNLKIELPVAVSTIPGNAEEGSLIIANKEQIHTHHNCQTKIDIADAKYDITENYQYIRDKGSIPIVDYNRRNENISKQALLDRGYDQNGWPFAPCGLLTRPNGFDKKRQRLTFCCFKTCLSLKFKALESLQSRYNIASCPHRNNQNGYVSHMSIQEHPRLVNEIPRGSKRYKEIKKIRSASERTNSTVKEDLKILDKPHVIGRPRAAILNQIAAIVLLLTRAFAFIVKTTCLFRKLSQTNDPTIRAKLRPAAIAKSIQNLIQLE